MEETIRGAQPARVSRPRTYKAGRVCAHLDCSTKLSVYNRRDHCNHHAPVRFPRVRGQVASEGAG